MCRHAALLCWFVLVAAACSAPTAVAQDNPFEDSSGAANSAERPPFADEADADDDPVGKPLAPGVNVDDLLKDPSASRRSVKRRKSSKQDPTPELEAEIRRQLAAPTTLDFVETPLRDAVDYLADLHGIPIGTDKRALEDIGIAGETLVSLKNSEVSLAAGLRLVLDQIGATYVVQDGVLLITSKAAAQAMVELKVYNIGNLITASDDTQELAQVVRSLFGRPPSVYGSPAAYAPAPARSDQGSQTAARRRAAAKPTARFEVVSYRDLLIVQASQHDHQEIERLLDAIRTKLRVRN